MPSPTSSSLPMDASDAITTSSPPPTHPTTDAAMMSQPSASSPSPAAVATVAEEHQLSSDDKAPPSSVVNDGDANMDPMDKEDGVTEEEGVVKNDNNTDVAMDDDDLESSPIQSAVPSPSNDPPSNEDDNKNQATKEEETPPPEEEDVIMECDKEEEGTAESEIMNNDNVKVIINAPPLPHSSQHATPEQRRHNANHLDETLDNLQHSISEAILEFRKEETTEQQQQQQQHGVSTYSNSGSSEVNNNAYLKLREAAVEAYHSLVEYGSSMDLSLVTTDDNGVAAPMSKGRREKLEKIGR